MPTLDFRSDLPVSAEALFDWHARPGAFQRLTPPWMPVELEKMEGIRDGQQVVFRLGVGPARVRWVAEHEDYAQGRQFKDVQKKGPFAAWAHTHRMEPDGEDESVLHDHLDYEMPLGGLGRAVGGAQVRTQIVQQFAYRHRITQQDLALRQRYDGPRLKIAVSGSHGLIGASLMHLLTTQGHTVRRLVRSRPKDPQSIYWNHRTSEIEAEKLEGLDAVVHLAGENVFAPRWTQAKKARIYNSRVRGTTLIAETLAGLDDPPGVLLTASAVGIYGDRGDEKLTASSPPAESGFLMAVCREWEAAPQPAADVGIRTAQLRTGVVLSPAGGALQLMLPAFQLGFGGTVGYKEQWFPWIALDDVLGGYYHALMTDDLDGPLNLAAPNPVQMQHFVRTLAGMLNRPAFFHIPPALLRLVMGEAADEFALTSARVLPERLQESGYAFRYPHLEGALRHLLGYAPPETIPLAA